MIGVGRLHHSLVRTGTNSSSSPEHELRNVTRSTLQAKLRVCTRSFLSILRVCTGGGGHVQLKFHSPWNSRRHVTLLSRGTFCVEERPTDLTTMHNVLELCRKIVSRYDASWLVLVSLLHLWFESSRAQRREHKGSWCKQVL